VRVEAEAEGLAIIEVRSRIPAVFCFLFVDFSRLTLVTDLHRRLRPRRLSAAGTCRRPLGFGRSSFHREPCG
jgi:hypothetical protein